MKLSYVHGVGTAPLIADTLGSAFNGAAERLARGYAVMLGYWNDEATANAIDAARWMHTGDLAVS